MKNIASILLKFVIKPILWIAGFLLVFYIALPIAVLLMIIIYMTLISILHLNRTYLKFKLKTIAKEARNFHNINIFENKEYIVFYNAGKMLSESIPDTLKNLNIISNKFKNKIGSMDCEEFLSNRNSYSAIDNIKKSKEIIFFSNLNKDKNFKEHAHLYDLQCLTESETDSLLSMDLSMCQKALIYRKKQT